jgi:hypothetical protein
MAGYDEAMIGLATPGVIASVYLSDSDDPGWVRCRLPVPQDAAVIQDWLLTGEMAKTFYEGNPLGKRLLAQLFVEAALGSATPDSPAGKSRSAFLEHWAAL